MSDTLNLLICGRVFFSFPFSLTRSFALSHSLFWTLTLSLWNSFYLAGASLLLHLRECSFCFCPQLTYWILNTYIHDTYYIKQLRSLVKNTCFANKTNECVKLSFSIANPLLLHAFLLDFPFTTGSKKFNSKLEIAC